MKWLLQGQEHWLTLSLYVDFSIANPEPKLKIADTCELHLSINKLAIYETSISLAILK